MRCKNCGWPNRPGETICQKCGTPLDSEKNFDDVYAASPSHMNATIPEQDAFGGKESEERICPKCGYPLRNNASKCPNCNYDVEPVRFANAEMNHRATRMENPAQESSDLSGTINPYMMNAAPEPTFILRPMKRLNEKKELTDLEYEGKKVILTRSNTEADNLSITSQNQAVIINSEGKWFIEDLSEQGTTFIRVSKKTEIQEGDTILLGNRLFEFHKSEE